MISNAIINEVPLKDMDEEIHKYVGGYGLLAFPFIIQK
jgi:hypothetical protein